MAPTRIGLVGYGAIGSYLAKRIRQDKGLELAFVHDIDPEKTKHIPPGIALSDMAQFHMRRPDLVVEAASQKAVRQLAPLVLGRCDLLVLSAGALADSKFERRARLLCKKHRMLIPSGALAGLDAISGLRDRLKTVTLTSTKNPKSLDRDDRERALVFSGTARQACRKMPLNVNVSATLSLAGIGFDRTRVNVYSDPAVEMNTHEVVATGDFGRLALATSNIPTPTNPRTSFLASLSAFDAIKTGRAAVVIRD